MSTYANRLHTVGSALARLIAIAIGTAEAVDQNPDCPCSVCKAIRAVLDSAT